MKVSKTYQTVTEKSSEVGDFEEQGYVYENKNMTAIEALREIETLGAIEWSDSVFNCQTYVSSVESEMNRDYFENGVNTYYSLHFEYENENEFELFKNLLINEGWIIK